MTIGRKSDGNRRKSKAEQNRKGTKTRIKIGWKSDEKKIFFRTHFGWKSFAIRVEIGRKSDGKSANRKISYTIGRFSAEIRVKIG